jgi:uncharacterized membrane protein
MSPASRGSTLPRLLFAVLVVAAAVHWAYYYPIVPEQVASHFGGGGGPNAWSSKGVFFALYAGGVALSAVFALGIPALAGASLIAVRHEDYWLAPERRAETLAFFEAQFAWFGCTMVLFIIAVMELAIRANLTVPARLDETLMWPLLGLYLVFVAVWIARFVRRFARPRP